MITFKTEITIEKPIQEVYNYVSNCESFDKWNSAVKKVLKTSEGPLSKGTTFDMIRKLPTGLVLNELEIIDYSPNELFTIKTISGPTPFTYSYQFIPTKDGTKIQLHANVKQKGFKVILPPLFPRLMKSGVIKNFNTLKKILEVN